MRGRLWAGVALGAIAHVAAAESIRGDEVGVSPDQARVELHAARPMLLGTTALSFDTCGPGHGLDDFAMPLDSLGWHITRAPRDSYDVAIRLRDGHDVLTFRHAGLSAGVTVESRAEEDPDRGLATLRLSPLGSPLCLRVFQENQIPADVATRVSKAAGVWLEGIALLPAEPRLSIRIDGIPLAEALSLIVDATGFEVRQLDESRYALSAKAAKSGAQPVSTDPE